MAEAFDSVKQTWIPTLTKTNSKYLTNHKVMLSNLKSIIYVSAQSR